MFRKPLMVLALGVALVTFCATPVLAGVGSNPNAELLTNVVCEEAGLSFETGYVPTPTAAVGHADGANIVGVAMSIWLTLADGTPVAMIDETPGKGLGRAQLTTWCYWEAEGSPTGFIGGDILLSGTVRP